MDGGERIDPATGEIVVPDRKLRHWDELCRTDPKHTKPFTRAGGFKGTAIRPIWNQYRLTEHFGPSGIGWGFERPEYEVVKADDELLVFCTIKCWYMDDNGERAEIYGVGGDKVLAKQQRGLVSDDEAFKKALTDAIGNAFVRVGLSADVHMGLFEDSKYVQDTRAHFAPSSNGGDDLMPPNDRTAPKPSVEARQTQGSAPAATRGHQRQEAAPAPSAAYEDAKKRYGELRDAIDAEETTAGLDGWPGSPAWQACAEKVAEAEGQAKSDQVMALLVGRIEGQKQMLLGATG